MASNNSTSANSAPASNSTPATSRTPSSNDPTASRARNHSEVIDQAKRDAAKGFGSKLGLEPVSLFVGPERKGFKVHKALFCAEAPYFNGMFNGGFAEAQENAASFPEDSPEVFELLVEWMYTRDYKDIDGDLPRKKVRTLLSHRLELYGLAEKICLPSLADCTMTVTIRNLARSNLVPGQAIVQRAYELVGLKSPLRKFMAECVYQDVFFGDRHSHPNDWSDEDGFGQRSIQDFCPR